MVSWNIFIVGSRYKMAIGYNTQPMSALYIHEQEGAAMDFHVSLLSSSCSWEKNFGGV